MTLHVLLMYPSELLPSCLDLQQVESCFSGVRSPVFPGSVITQASKAYGPPRPFRWQAVRYVSERLCKLCFQRLVKCKADEGPFLIKRRVLDEKSKKKSTYILNSNVSRLSVHCFSATAASYNYLQSEKSINLTVK